MEKELNIAAILKEKPAELKLYSPTYGYIRFNGVHKGRVYFYSEDTNAHSVKQNGKMYDDGECIIFPSKSMRSWEKFAWKKGDVLTDNVSTICMFDGWANEDYTEFKAKYTLHLVASTNAENEVCKTNNFVSVLKEEDKQSYLATAETYFNVKLSKGLLEIEQPKQEFKDGDIVTLEGSGSYAKCVIIFKNYNPQVISNDIHYHALLNVERMKMGFDNCVYNRENNRLATDSEKQQLCSALAKEGKHWNPSTKQIEDLPKKCELKAFQKVLTRDTLDEKWRPNLFSNYNREKSEYMYGCIAGGCDAVYSKYCIPYNDSTKHLLGTTDEWKGGEG